MTYTYNLIPANLPAWLDFDGLSWDTHYLSDEQLAAQGWLPLIYDPEGAPLGYADPVAETRDGRQVAVAYALGTEQERTAATLATLKAQAHAARRTERERREATTYPHAETRFDADERSMIRWGLVVSMALLAAGTEPEAIIVPDGWRDTHGTPLLWTAQQILVAQQSLLLWGAQCDGASQSIAADIEAATEVAALEAILAAIPTDPRWPE